MIEATLGIGLFSVITAYEYKRTIADFEEGNIDSWGHATLFHLDIINIFIRVLEILGKISKIITESYDFVIAIK